MCGPMHLLEFLISDNEAFRLTSMLEESFGVSSVWTSNRICDISASYDTGRVCSDQVCVYPPKASDKSVADVKKDV